MSTSPGSPDRFWSHRRSIPQANSVATALQTVTRLAAGLLTVASATASWAGTTVEWKDRKSTRLNSSHSQISYAVFCLKKKTYEHRDLSSTHRTAPGTATFWN